MAGSNNYYAWLGLSVERFENDPNTLSETVEKKITEWNSHKSENMKNRANIHGENIRKAIKDPAEWERIYREYKSEFDAEIADSLIYFVFDQKIKISDVENISKKFSNKEFKLSSDYVRKICENQKYTVVDDNGGETQKQKDNIDFTVNDLLLGLSEKFKTPHKFVTELGSENLMKLLENPDIFGKQLDENAPNDKVLEILAELKDKWKNIPQNGKKGTIKSHIDKICSGFKDTLKKASFSDYIQYLKYLGAKNELDELIRLKIEELNENAFDSKVMQLFEFTEDHDKAKSVLMAFCQEKNIAYPVPRPKLAMCPFPECGKSFERTEPLQRACPVCGRSLIVLCPVCGKEKHIITDKECDGINIGGYPLLEKLLRSADQNCDSLNLENARYKLADLASRWPNYPGADKIKQRLDKLESEHGADILKIADHCNKNEFYAARSLIDRINSSFPGFKNDYGTVYSTIEFAEEQFAEAMKETDISRKINFLIAINESIADFAKLNAELLKYPVEPVTALNAAADSRLGVVTLSWQSENKANSVFYIVKRKRGAAVSSAADGEELGKTQNLSFGDTSAEEGILYYYAVFAFRGTTQSPLCSMPEPVVILKEPVMNITPGDACIDISWEPTPHELKVFCSDKPITKFGEGTPVGGLSNAGVLIDGLTNGTAYCIAAYKSVTSGGREYRSELAVFPPVTPIKPVKPPRLTKLIGSKEGEYLLAEETSSEHDIVLYYTDSKAGIAENAMISLSDMEKKAKKLNYEKTPDGKFKVDMSDKRTMIVYPAVNLSGSLMVGNIISLMYVKLTDITTSVSGSTLCLTIDGWQDGIDQIIVCYNFDQFPEDSADCDRINRLSFTKKDYDKNRIFGIPNVKPENYFISVFARSGGDETLIGNKQVNLAKKAKIGYTVKKQFLSGIKVTLNSGGGYRPKLTFAVGSGSVPLSRERAVFTFDIPENVSAPSVEVISVPKFNMPRNPYAKIFCDDAGFEVLASGSMQL